MQSKALKHNMGNKSLVAISIYHTSIKMYEISSPFVVLVLELIVTAGWHNLFPLRFFEAFLLMMINLIAPHKAPLNFPI
jgi:hypothetical protein